MKTICIQIGNSDDKLGRLEWVHYIQMVNRAINDVANDVHFTGFSVPTAIWQNACWVFEIENDRVEIIKTTLEIIRKGKKQDSIAWLEGEVEFI